MSDAANDQRGAEYRTVFACISKTAAAAGSHRRDGISNVTVDLLIDEDYRSIGLVQLQAKQTALQISVLG